MTPPAPRRYVAQVGRFKRPGLLVVFGLVGLMGLMAGLGALLPANTMKDVAGLAVTGFAIVYIGVLAWALRPRSVPLDLWPDRVVLDEGRGGTFPLSGALLGPWVMPSYGVSWGTVLHLRAGERSLRLGGRDHRPPPGMRIDAPPADRVDAYVSAADLASIVASLPAGTEGDPYRPPGAPAVVRCLLVPNRASARGVLRMMAPWGAAMLASMLVAGGFDVLGLYEHPWGQTLALGIVILVVVAGIVATVLVARKTPAPALEIEIDAGTVRLVDLASARVVASAALGSVAVTRGLHRYGGRTRFEAPVLTLALPGTDPVSLTVPDVRFGWTDPTPDPGAGRYVVGSPDWLALVEAFGARDWLKS